MVDGQEMTCPSICSMEIRAEQISRRFGQRQVLEQISCTIAHGSSMALAGPSGRGKSSLLACLGGLDPVDSGSVFWDEHLIRAPLATNQLADVALLTQHPRLESRLSVGQNIQLAAAFRGGFDSNRYQQLIAEFQIAELIEQPAGQISGGQAVRVAAVRCLLRKPQLVLADEPTASLDAATARDIGNILLYYGKTDNATVIMASHDPELIEQCDQQFYFDQLPQTAETSEPCSGD